MGVDRQRTPPALVADVVAEKARLRSGATRSRAGRAAFLRQLRRARDEAEDVRARYKRVQAAFARECRLVGVTRAESWAAMGDYVVRETHAGRLPTRVRTAWDRLVSERATARRTLAKREVYEEERRRVWERTRGRRRQRRRERARPGERGRVV